MGTHRLGRYTILEEIGSGGFSTVFRAEDTVLEREVAVKVMQPLLMSDRSFVARFEREARVAANLEHPHIIPIHDFGEENGRLYLVMKLVKQGSLEQRLRHGPLPFEQVLTITQQIAAALDYAHQQQVIHRDIKPDNVLLDNDNHAYLADFGLVKALEHSSLTASLSGGILGTPAYVAPEIWHGGEASPQTDVYALACLLFEMVNGRSLFDAPTPPAAMLAHFQEPQFPNPWPEGTPPGIEQILHQALVQESSERYASAGELAQALKALTPAKPPAEIAPIVVEQKDSIQPAVATNATGTNEEDSDNLEPRGQERAPLTVQKVAAAPVSPDLSSQADAASAAPIRSSPAAKGVPSPKNRTWPKLVLAIVAIFAVMCLCSFLAAILSPASTEPTAETRQAQEQIAATLVTDANRIFGPRGGTLTHREGIISNAWANIETQNFVVEAIFLNPYPLSNGRWDYGFQFRHNEQNQHLLLCVNSSRRWLLYELGAGGYRNLASGPVSNMNTRADGSNEIRLITQNERGWLYVNDQFVTELDLSTRTDAGNLAIATGIAAGYQVADEITRYTHFTVSSIP